MNLNFFRIIDGVGLVWKIENLCHYVGPYLHSENSCFDDVDL